MPGVDGNPKAATELDVPTYTLPLHTVGTANLTAPPRSLLRKSSVPRFVASQACKTAWPELFSYAQTIPLPFPLDEIVGVAPGKSKVVFVDEAGPEFSLACELN